jgi:hypothetical protein
VGKAEGKRPLGRPTYIWEDNIKVDLRESMGRYGLDLPGSRYGQVEGSCEHNIEPSGSVTFWEILE